mmetsp:Transcript_57560/g.136907  ORF Transcript_57560/g.136907 Transcript_57560/m.136907 type:complete len:411 (+) Transcript_57560:83-1315(+)
MLGFRAALKRDAVFRCRLAYLFVVGVVVSWVFSDAGTDRAGPSFLPPAGRVPQHRNEISRRGLALATLAEAGLVGMQSPAEALTKKEKAVVQLFQSASPSVASLVNGDVLRQTGVVEERPVVGCGFAWDQHHLVTAHSLLKGIGRVRVAVTDKNEDGSERRRLLHATVVGVDTVQDVAVLWVDGEMQPLRRGSSEDLMIGQEVYALGNPFGLEQSLSKGVISGLSRTLPSPAGRPMSGIIQTDASINPGNRGGPLLDADGNLIGVNYAIVSTTGGNAGVGFAMPIETIERSVTSLILQGVVRWPTLGVTLTPDEVSKQLGIPGVMVRNVNPGGPAEVAGIKPVRGGRLGDIIVGVDGSPIQTVSGFFKALDGKRPGEDVTLTMLRSVANPVMADKFEAVNLQVRLDGKVM